MNDNAIASSSYSYAIPVWLNSQDPVFGTAQVLYNTNTLDSILTFCHVCLLTVQIVVALL